MAYIISFIILFGFPLTLIDQSVSQRKVSPKPSVPERDMMRDRIAQIKKSIVRVLVNGQASGTGFVVTTEGLIATCFHVVQEIQPAPNGQSQISYASKIEVEFIDGIKLAATVDSCCQNQNFLESLSKDFVILKVRPPKDLAPLKLGSFADSYEGAAIYISGYPFGLDKPFTSKGILSTKISTPGYLGQGGNRDAALLDITLNKGNSGGPVILLGEDPKDDMVIGVATFTLSPLSPPLAQLVQIAQDFPGSATLMGVNFKDFSLHIKNAFESTSVGIGGCISIDYLKSKIK